MDKVIDFLLKFLDVLVWPFIVFILILIFKDKLLDLIDRIRIFRYKDTVIGFDQFGMDEGKPPQALESVSNEKDQASAPQLSSNKPATLFWLANDLMWIQDMLLRNAPSKNVIKGLKNLRVYVQDLGMKGSLADIELLHLLRGVETTTTTLFRDWSPEYRLALVRQIESIKWLLATRAEDAEPKFKKLRVFYPRGKNSGS